jgi:hypothetical protein
MCQLLLIHDTPARVSFFMAKKVSIPKFMSQMKPFKIKKTKMKVLKLPKIKTRRITFR